MALLQDIIAEATQEACDVPSLLRKALVLASRLRNDYLKAWVAHELNGYPSEADVPPYRRTEVISYGFFADRFIGQATLQIPLAVLPSELRERYRNLALQQPINEMVDMLHRSKEQSSPILLPWPPGALQYAQKVSQLECIKAWRQLNPSFTAGVIDTVKTRILSMALDLEAADPTAGEVPSTNLKLSETAVSKIITTHIHGTVQNFSAGGDHVTQSAKLVVRAGDKTALLRALQSVGVSPEEVTALSEAIDADKRDAEQPSTGLGARVKAWLADLQFKAAQHLGTVSTEVVGGVITQALLLYFGIAS